MCAPPRDPVKPIPARRLGAGSVVLPFVAGCLHLSVFCTAVAGIYNVFANRSQHQYSSDEYRGSVFSLDRAVFVAYMFDIVCCLVGVIPFSRCSKAKDILGHHIPTLVLALPLAVPLWSNLKSLEPTLEILEVPMGDATRNRFIDAFTLASGFAYISSLNEVIMCFQRTEMSFQQVTSFRDIDQMKFKLLTSRAVVGFELLYKLCFFWGMSILACKACFDFDMSIYSFVSRKEGIATLSKVAYIYTRRKEGMSTLSKLSYIYTSPAVLRGVLFRVFAVVMYPSMGARSLKKFQQFINEGKPKIGMRVKVKFEGGIVNGKITEVRAQKSSYGIKINFVGGRSLHFSYPNNNVEILKSQ